MKPSDKDAKSKPKPGKKPKPKKVGRPSLGREAKNIPVTIKISMNEKLRWERRAKALGMGLNEYILHPLRNVDKEGNEK